MHDPGPAGGKVVCLQKKDVYKKLHRDLCFATTNATQSLQTTHLLTHSEATSGQHRDEPTEVCDIMGKNRVQKKEKRQEKRNSGYNTVYNQKHIRVQQAAREASAAKKTTTCRSSSRH